MTTQNEEKSIIYLKWEEVVPDKRQWKPSMPKLLPENVYIAVEVPHDMIYQDDPTLTLTPTGMRYVIDQLEAVMSDKPEKQESDSVEEWEDEPKTTTKDFEVEEPRVTGKKVVEDDTDEFMDEFGAEESKNEKQEDFEEVWE